MPTQRALLACGAELKSTFCLARGERAWVSHHIGDLGNWETLRAFREGVAHFQELFAVAPRLVAHDLHPEYLSTSYALARAEQEPHLRLLAVQHHHAHLAAVLAEHGERGPAVGAIYDGAGYGTDGTVWGGELLVGDLRGFVRAGHLRPVRLPGGDGATREPWRMACEWLARRAATRCRRCPPALDGSVDPERWTAVARIAGEGVASPVTTSVGRLCDAVAAICGAARRVSYEGQAAVELEAQADPHERGRYAMPFEDGQLDARPAIVRSRRRSPPVARARRSRRAFTTRWRRRRRAHACDRAGPRRRRSSCSAAACFQNRLLLEAVAARVGPAGCAARARAPGAERRCDLLRTGGDRGG